MDDENVYELEFLSQQEVDELIEELGACDETDS
jgi:hypothetical protein